MSKRRQIWVEESDKKHAKRKKKAIDKGIKLERYYGKLLDLGEKND